MAQKSNHVCFQLLAVIQVLLGLLVFFVGCSSNIDSRPSSADPIVVDEKTLDIGNVWLKDEIRHYIAITNPRKEIVKIDGVHTSCGCATASCPKQLEPGEHGKIELKIAMKQENASKLSTKEYPVSLDISCVFEEITFRPQVWHVKGKILRPLVASSNQLLYYGKNRLIRDQLSKSQSLTVSPQANIDIGDFNVCCDEAFGTATVEKTPERNYVITFRPSDELPVGEFSTNIVFDAKLRNGESLPSLSIPVRGEVGTEVEVLPSALVFTPDHDWESLTLRSSSERPFSILWDQISCSPLNIAAKHSSGSSVRSQHKIVFERDRQSELPVEVSIKVIFVGENKPTTIKVPVCTIGQ